MNSRFFRTASFKSVLKVELERHHSGAFHLHGQISFLKNLRSNKLCHLSEQVIEPNMADFKAHIPIEIELRLLAKHEAIFGSSDATQLQCTSIAAQ